jgi:hypothetical protein
MSLSAPITPMGKVIVRLTLFKPALNKTLLTLRVQFSSSIVASTVEFGSRVEGSEFGTEYCNRVLTFDPEFHDAHTYLLDIYSMKGMDREVLNEFIQADSMDAKGAQALRELFAREGLHGVFKEECQSHLKQWSSENNRRNFLALGIGRLSCHLRDNEQALKWLALAVERPQTFWTPYINVDPLYDPLRGDPRFKEILRRINLP